MPDWVQNSLILKIPSGERGSTAGCKAAGAGRRLYSLNIIELDLF